MAREPRSLRFKYYFVLGLLIGGAMIASNLTPKNNVSGSVTSSGPIAPQTLEQRLDGITSGSATIKGQLSGAKSLADVKVTTLLIYNLADGVSTAKTEVKDRPELQAKLKAAQQSVSQLQATALPKLRKAYADALASAMWENDIYVTTAGGALQFTNVAFASNGNVKKVEEGLGEMIPLLRYKQTQYYWHKGSSYVSFDHKPLPDSTVAVVQGGKLVGIGN